MIGFDEQKLIVQLHERMLKLEERIDAQKSILKVLAAKYEEPFSNCEIAEEDYEVGETIMTVYIDKCEVSDEPTKYSAYSKLIKKHLSHKSFRYINHSCDPNTIPCTQFDWFKFIAIKPIKAGEEITFNYTHNEPEISNPFNCTCGSDNCIEYIN